MKHPQLLLVPLLAGLVPSPGLRADTTIDPVDKFAWAANSGWVNFAGDGTHGVVVGETYLSGYAWAANSGWVNFGDGTPANGHSYANTGSDHGVNQDGAGNLSGYAWSANSGWINFGWAAANDPNRPRLSIVSGVFSGYAWSANTGWVNLGTGRLTTGSIDCPDTDGDGIADHWERLHFTDLATAGVGTDFDHDGVSDAGEYAADTDPRDAGSKLKVISQSYDGTHTEVVLEFTSSPSRLYRIEYSGDLGLADPWTDSSLGTFAPDAGTTTSRTITFPGNPSKFFRVAPVRPLSP